MKGTSCDKCYMGYKPSDVEICSYCSGEFCAGCLKNHDGC